MSEENQLSAEEIPAPVQEETVIPETAELTPETSTEQSTKTFTQEELDAIVGKRLAREQRKWERDQASKIVEKSTVLSSDLRLDQFQSTEDYAIALAEQKAEQLVAERETKRQFESIVNAYADREEAAREKYDDFDQVALNAQVKISDVMANVIRMSEIGPDIAYHLGSNPKEAETIFRLNPLMQAKEIGRIEAKLKDSPPVKKTTNAPPPISPISSSKTSSSSSYDTTDPRSIKSMTTSEWIEADRKRQIKKAEARSFR